MVALKSLSIVVLLIVGLMHGNARARQIDFPVQTCVSALVSGDYLPCLGRLAHSIWKVHQWSDDTSMTICGIPCSGNLKGRLSKLKWKWDGRFRCETKAPGIVGQDSKKSRNGAMEWAIRDFLGKAVAAGKVKVEEFNC